MHRFIPFLLNHRGHQHADDPDTCETYDHPEHDEPRGGFICDRPCQGGEDVDEFQGRISQQEGVVNAIPGLPVARMGNKADLECFQTNVSVTSEVWQRGWFIRAALELSIFKIKTLTGAGETAA